MTAMFGSAGVYAGGAVDLTPALASDSPVEVQDTDALVKELVESIKA